MRSSQRHRGPLLCTGCANAAFAHHFKHNVTGARCTSVVVRHIPTTNVSLLSCARTQGGKPGNRNWSLHKVLLGWVDNSQDGQGVQTWLCLNVFSHTDFEMKRAVSCCARFSSEPKQYLRMWSFFKRTFYVKVWAGLGVHLFCDQASSWRLHPIRAASAIDRLKWVGTLVCCPAVNSRCACTACAAASGADRCALCCLLLCS